MLPHTSCFYWWYFKWLLWNQISRLWRIWQNCCLWTVADQTRLFELAISGKTEISLFIRVYVIFIPKPSLKIGSVNKAFLFWYWQRPKKYFFRNKTFLFFKIESWNFQHLFEIDLRESSQNFNSFSISRQLLFSSFFIGCLIELKFCKVSRN